MPAALAAALGRSDRVPAKRALEVGRAVLDVLQHAALGPPHIGVSGESSLVFSFHRDRKFVTYECAANGDVIFVLWDKASREDAKTEVLSSSGVEPSVYRAREFLH